MCVLTKGGEAKEKVFFFPFHLFKQVKLRLVKIYFKVTHQTGNKSLLVCSICKVPTFTGCYYLFTTYSFTPVKMNASKAIIRNC